MDNNHYNKKNVNSSRNADGTLKKSTHQPTGQSRIDNNSRMYYGNKSYDNLMSTTQYSIKGKNKVKSNVMQKGTLKPGIYDSSYKNMTNTNNEMKDFGKYTNRPYVDNTDKRDEENGEEYKKENNKKITSYVSTVITDVSGVKKTHNEEMTKVVVGVMLLCVAMMVYLVYFTVIKSKEIINQGDNSHATRLAETMTKGCIFDRNGKVIVQTNENDKREYMYNDLFAHSVGYVNDKGRTGIESKYEYTMLNTHSNYGTQFLNKLKGVKNDGDSIQLTFDVDVQKAAEEAMEDYEKGAVIALDPENGEVLAMYSKPTYNPNTMVEEYDKIEKDNEGAPLLNRATQGLYPPGSTFKIATALEYLNENDDNYQSFEYDCKGQVEYSESYTLHCYESEEHGKQDMKMAFANSCNTAFAEIGSKLNISEYNKMCKEKLFVGKELPWKYSEYASGKFNLKERDASDLKAQTFIGQGNTLVTPLHIALLTSAIANDGVLMQPLVVSSIVSKDNHIIEKYDKEEASKVMTKEQSDILKEFMKEVTDNGTARGVFTSSEYEVYGKTGSAENRNEKAHAWFTGYGENNLSHKKLVVCVIVENAGTGSAVASPVADEVLKKYFEKN